MARRKNQTEEVKFFIEGAKPKMYCATCGTLIETKLNYCNRCGARIEKLAAASAEMPSSQQSLSMGAGFIGLGGLGMTLGLIAILLKNNVVIEAVVILVMCFLATVFGISFLMIRQISKMTNQTSNKQISEKPNTAQLEEFREPARSVIENTTRTFDKIPFKEN